VGWNEAAEEIGLTSSHNRWRVLIGLLSFDANLYGQRYPGIFLNMIWFLVAFAAFVTAAYHVLILLLPIFGVTLGSAP
jgi:hypothetical protein